MKTGGARKQVHLALLTSLAVCLHMVEMFIPTLSFLVPGAKLGLANVVTLVTIMIYDWKAAFIVAVLRAGLGSFLSGTFLTTMFLLSFAGAIASALVMGLVFNFNNNLFSPMGVSILGAVTHNVVQLLVAAFIIQTLGIFFYLPYLLLFALPTGYFTGIVASLVVRYLKREQFIGPQ